MKVINFDDLLVSQRVNIVVLGTFNPSIINPSWLALKHIIREEEAEYAQIEIIHSEVVQFKLKWTEISGDINRFSFGTSLSTHFDALKDLVISIFHVLSETKIRAIGLNHIFDLNLQNKELYNEVGSKLTNFDLFSTLSDPKMLGLEILNSERYDDRKGYYRLRIIPTGKKGSYTADININDHIDVSNEEIPIDVIEKAWTSSHAKATETAYSIIENLRLGQ